MRPTAFVSAPYSAAFGRDIGSNILVAQRCAIWLWDHCYYVLCPHLNTQHFEVLTTQPYNTFMQFCLHTIRSGLIDVIVMTGAWQTSSGALQELKLAHTLAIPVCEFQLYWQPPELRQLSNEVITECLNASALPTGSRLI